MRARIIGTLGLSALLVGALALPASAYHEGIVTPSDSRWYFSSDHVAEDGTVTATTGTGGITAVPVPGAWGTDGYELTIPAGQKARAMTDLYNGRPLEDLEKVVYSTYVDSASLPGYGPSINVMIDPEGPDDFATLVWEANKAGFTIGVDTWQEWDTTSGTGGWWSPSIQPFTSSTPGSNSHPGQLAAMSDFFGADSVILGVAVNVGRHGAMTSYIDGVQITANGQTDTYDFETTAPTKDDCKAGGWEQLGFRNQGQCVSHVATGSKH